ncbi:MAG: transcriptional regulator, partial [Bacteroidales bacterium]|nr:transcriptional regulator [Bacteroidales bacterium]
MNEQIREIAHRLYGLRDALGLSVAELAKVSHVSEAD